MISSKGFLSPGPDRRPRMTAKHKAAVLKAVVAVLDWVTDNHDLDALHQAGLAQDRLMVTAALDAYPTDRSCHTCDLFTSHVGTGAQWCRHWKQEVPPDAVEAGCDHHQEHAVPF